MLFISCNCFLQFSFFSLLYDRASRRGWFSFSFFSLNFFGLIHHRYHHHHHRFLVLQILPHHVPYFFFPLFFLFFVGRCQSLHSIVEGFLKREGKRFPFFHDFFHLSVFFFFCLFAIPLLEAKCNLIAPLLSFINFFLYLLYLSLLKGVFSLFLSSFSLIIFFFSYLSFYFYLLF